MIASRIDTVIKEGKHLLDNIPYLTTRNMRAHYIACTGTTNLGDNLLQDSIYALFGDAVRFYCPDRDNQKLGRLLRSVDRPTINAVFLGGGTLIKKGPEEGYFQRVLEHLDRFPNSKLIAFGTGVADPTLSKQVGFPTDTAAWKDHLNKAAYIGVRGPLSVQMLQEWGVKAPIHQIGDPVLYLANDTIQPKALTKKIGINIANVPGRFSKARMLYGFDPEAVIDFTAELLMLLTKDDWQIKLLPMKHLDIDYLARAATKANMPNLPILKNFGDLQTAKAFMEDVDIFLGQRLHSLVLAAITYTPFVSLEYEMKVRDFALSIDYSDRLFRTDNLNAEATFDAIKSAYADVENQQKHLHHQVLSHKRTLVNAANTVQKIISE
jgi:polysaccharide pyruvyl transferase WcaK-like protein